MLITIQMHVCTCTHSTHTTEVLSAYSRGLHKVFCVHQSVQMRLHIHTFTYPHIYIYAHSRIVYMYMFCTYQGVRMRLHIHTSTYCIHVSFVHMCCQAVQSAFICAGTCVYTQTTNATQPFRTFDCCEEYIYIYIYIIS